MINLGRCIRYLLGQHDRVAVSGVGSFQIVRTPGFYEEATQQFYPAGEEIHFEADGGAGEGALLIVDYLVSQQRLSRGAAQALFRKSIADVLQALEVEGRVLLDGLGELRQENDQLAFLADESVVEKRDLLSVHDLPVISDEVVDIPERDGSPVPIREEETTAASGGGWFWKAAGILVLVGGTFLAATAVLRPDLIRAMRMQWEAVGTEPLVTAELPATKGGEVMDKTLADTSKIGAATLDSAALDSAALDHPIVPTVSADSTLEAVAPQADGPVVTYEIIVASFKTMEQAEQFVSEMKEKGISLRAIDSRQAKNRKKVSYGSYKTSEEAYRALPQVQKTLEPGAWVDRLVR